MVMGRLARIIGGGLCALVATVAVVSNASAQFIPTPEASIPERQSVLQRARPDYDPLGIQAGSFLLLPSMDLQEWWDSNVYATPTADKTDMVTAIVPQLSVASDWNNHALNLFVGDQSEFYQTHTTENVNNVTVASQGRFDIQRDFYISGGAGVQLSHEDRSSPNAFPLSGVGKYPTQFTVADGNLGITRDVGVVGASLTGDVQSYSYNNNVDNADNEIPEAYRDYIQYTVTPRVTYEIVPGYHAFIQTPLNERQYDRGVDPFGFNHSSHGYEGDVGTAVNLGSALNGEVFVGYLRQDYEDRVFGSPQGLTGGANLLWNATDLTSFRLAVSRVVEEEAAGITTTGISGSYIESTGKVSVEHELLRNVVLNASGTYFIDQFSGVNRTDNNFTAYAGAKYLMNRVLSLGFDATFWHRDSNQPGVNYDREIIGVRLHLQL
jgi:hypothetical protein